MKIIKYLFLILTIALQIRASDLGKSMTLENLPTDIKKNIIGNLSDQELRSLSQTSKTMFVLTSTPLKDVRYKPRDPNCSLDKLFPLNQHSYIHKVDFTKTKILHIDRPNIDIGRNIVHLNLDSSGISPKNLKKLWRSIAEQGILENLNLSMNSIKDHQAKYIAKMIEKTKSLVDLNISHNHLKERGSEKILKSIKNNALLQKLNINANVIGLKGFKLLKEILQYSAHLQRFDYSDHRDLDDKKIKLLASGLAENKSLHQVTFGQHKITDDSKNCLLQALTVNTSIQTALLMDMNIGDASISYLQALVEKNFVLKDLYISSCWCKLNGENDDKLYQLLCARQNLHIQY